MRTLSLIAWFALSSAHASNTLCTWANQRNGMSFESVSSIHVMDNIPDCVNTMGLTNLILEPNRGQTSFDGVFYLKDSSEKVIAQCTSKTVQPILEEAKQEKLFWMFTTRSTMDDATYIKTLRSDEWQKFLKSYFTVDCEAPTS